MASLDKNILAFLLESINLNREEYEQVQQLSFVIKFHGYCIASITVNLSNVPSSVAVPGIFG